MMTMIMVMMTMMIMVEGRQKRTDVCCNQRSILKQPAKLVIGEMINM